MYDPFEEDLVLELVEAEEQENEEIDKSNRLPKKAKNHRVAWAIFFLMVVFVWCMVVVVPACQQAAEENKEQMTNTTRTAEQIRQEVAEISQRAVGKKN